MLVLFEKIAVSCSWLRVPVILAFVIMSSVCAWVLLLAPVAVQDRWLIPSLLLMLWLLMAVSVLLLFARVPDIHYQSLQWTGKIRRKLIRFFFHVLAWFMLTVSAALVVVSLQLMMAWYRSTYI